MTDLQIELNKIVGNFIEKYKEFSDKFFQQNPNYHNNKEIQNVFNNMTIDTIKFLAYIFERYNVKIDICIFCLHHHYTRGQNICKIPEKERTKEIIDHYNNFGKYIIKEANADKWKKFGQPDSKPTFQLYKKRKLEN
jgi:hypothetical protein